MRFFLQRSLLHFGSNTVFVLLSYDICFTYILCGLALKFGVRISFFLFRFFSETNLLTFANSKDVEINWNLTICCTGLVMASWWDKNVWFNHRLLPSFVPNNCSEFVKKIRGFWRVNGILVGCVFNLRKMETNVLTTFWDNAR